ncbi:hypothetical protein [Pelobacter propionicus]|nr:hypothetical protein [Pelobacter propionicus]
MTSHIPVARAIDLCRDLHDEPPRSTCSQRSAVYVVGWRELLTGGK